MRIAQPRVTCAATHSQRLPRRTQNAEVAAIIRQPDMQERWTQMALSALDNSPEQFAAWLADQAEQWGKLIREAGVKAE